MSLHHHTEYGWVHHRHTVRYWTTEVHFIIYDTIGCKSTLIFGCTILRTKSLVLLFKLNLSHTLKILSRGQPSTYVAKHKFLISSDLRYKLLYCFWPTTLVGRNPLVVYLVIDFLSISLFFVSFTSSSIPFFYKDLLSTIGTRLFTD